MAGSSISCWHISSALKEVRDLRRVMDSLIGAKKCDEAFEIKEQIFIKLNEIREVLYFTTLERAKEILGEDLIDPKELESVLGFEVGEAPKIPFNSEMLQRAKEVGMRLILRVPEQEVCEPYLPSNDLIEGQVDSEWVLVSKDLIDGKMFKTLKLMDAVLGSGYSDQTHLMADMIDEYYNNGSHGIKMPSEVSNALAEWRAEKGDNWPSWEQATELANQKINQIFRHSPVELVYDWLVISKLRDGDWLKSKDVWTNKALIDEQGKGDVVCMSSIEHADGRIVPWLKKYTNRIHNVGSLLMLRGEDEIKKKLRSLQEEGEEDE